MNLVGPSPEKIKNLFSSIHQTYDLTNDVMTFGLVRRWRKMLVNWSQAAPGSHILDCATGTGDLAFEFKKKVGPTGKVTGIDFCPEMLEPAYKKAQKLQMDVQFLTADMTNLPFEDNTFDVTSVAYGIRNVEDPIKALQEMSRVTKPKGFVMILETGEPQGLLLKKGVQLYFKKVVPLIGGVISGKKDAYEYLSSSSCAFPSAKEFLNLLKSTKSFAACEHKNLLGSFLYKAVVAK
ncbi:MAG: bifunctional demethylmenaquinone methyltransferase/2-methoxy-6-polyprenyl-1,4-benzoquinol methylase UbiE [Bdellovibrio sp.]|nr:MAG: bifunctional demethylmenaquinone methyltransferase/2-methoxy-6-polyprenyl-1,4-benzoquinol methylase UbiE [Bdellovibrio sp.]